MRHNRRIIKIDESKCDGCGVCANACHEGAIVIEGGVAKLASESYCDGLGDCIGECPRGAITFEEREADAYDEAEVKRRMAEKTGAHSEHSHHAGGGCPGAMARNLQARPAARESHGAAGATLSNWPIQLALVPTNASYLKNARLLIAADCTAFSLPTFHSELLPGKVCLIGCPKLDDSDEYVAKLTELIKNNAIKSIDVAYMEVPCCGGLLMIVRKAVSESGIPVQVQRVKLSLEGEILERDWD